MSDNPVSVFGTGRRQTFLVALAVLLVDQLTKWLVVSNLPIGAEWAPIPWLANSLVITHTTNTGAAFGLAPDAGWIFVVIAVFVILGIIFVLGWPLEWVPIVLIVVPILLPLVQKLGIDIVWFCTLVAVCLQTAWLSPPVALSAYFLKGVVPDWELGDIYKGMIQFMVLQVFGK